MGIISILTLLFSWNVRASFELYCANHNHDLAVWSEQTSDNHSTLTFLLVDDENHEHRSNSSDIHHTSTGLYTTFTSSGSEGQMEYFLLYDFYGILIFDGRSIELECQARSD